MSTATDYPLFDANHAPFDTQIYSAHMDHNGAIADVATSPEQRLPSVAKSVRWKTELCAGFSANGVCQYGDRCQFAHGAHELRPVTRHPKYKSKVCRNWKKFGTCKYNHRCQFAHPPELAASVRAHTTPLQQPVGFVVPTMSSVAGSRQFPPFVQNSPCLSPPVSPPHDTGALSQHKVTYSRRMSWAAVSSPFVTQTPPETQLTPPTQLPITVDDVRKCLAVLNDSTNDDANEDDLDATLVASVLRGVDEV